MDTNRTQRADQTDTEPSSQSDKSRLMALDILMRLYPENKKLQDMRNALARELGEPEIIRSDDEINAKLKRYEEQCEELEKYYTENFDKILEASAKVQAAMKETITLSEYQLGYLTVLIPFTIARYDDTLVEAWELKDIDSLVDIVYSTLEEMPPEERDRLLRKIDEQEREEGTEELSATGSEEKPKKRRKPRALSSNGLDDFSKIAENLILQGTATNTLTKIKACRGNVAVDDITGTATSHRGDFTLTITNYKQIAGLKTSTHQLLDALTLKLTADPRKDGKIYLPLSEYMEMRGIKDVKTAREQVDADLEILYGASISYTEKRGKKRENYLDVRICDAKGIKNGIIEFSFGPTFLSILKNYPLMPYPPALQRTNNTHCPNSYYLGRKIAELKNMNAGRKNENLISVRTLLENAPEIPSYEEVIKTDRALNRRIIEPIERDLDALEDTFTWEYCHSKGEPLTDSELETMDYDTFKDCLVRITWKDYPDQTERLREREQKIKEAKEKKAKEEKKTKEEKKAEEKKRPRGRPKKEPVKESTKAPDNLDDVQIFNVSAQR